MKSGDPLEQLRRMGEHDMNGDRDDENRAARILAAIQDENGKAPPRSPARIRRHRLPRKWFRHRLTATDRAINVAIALCFLVGALLMLKTPYDYYMRQQTSNALAQVFDNGGFIEVAADAYAIPGEQLETLASETRPTETSGTVPAETASTTAEPAATEATAAPTNAPYVAPKVTLQSIGMLSIPKIKNNDPILEGATEVDLRYGIGRYPPSAPIGAVGRTVLLGHKMKLYGVYFSRLYEMAIGDTFSITTAKAVYAYKVYNITSVYKDQLLNEIFAPCEGSQAMLVTCDFRKDPKGNNRFLVHAMLVSTTPR